MNAHVRLGTIITDLYTEIGRHNPVFASVYDNGTYSAVGLWFAVHFHCTIGVNTYHRFVHFLIATQAVSVWYALGEDWALWDTPWDDWVNSSNHDSCWRMDGVHNRLEDAYQKFREEMEHLASPKELGAHAISADLGCMRPFTWVRIFYKAAPTSDDNRGRYVLTRVDELQNRRYSLKE